MQVSFLVEIFDEWEIFHTDKKLEAWYFNFVDD